MDEAALAGQELLQPRAEQPRARREKTESRTPGQLGLKPGDFIVQDVESAPSELIKLQLDHPRRRRTTGFVWTGRVTKVTKKNVFLAFL